MVAWGHGSQWGLSCYGSSRPLPGGAGPPAATHLPASPAPPLPPLPTVPVGARIGRILSALEAQPTPSSLGPPITEMLQALAPAVRLAPARAAMQAAANPVRWGGGPRGAGEAGGGGALAAHCRRLMRSPLSSAKPLSCLPPGYPPLPCRR